MNMVDLPSLRRKYGPVFITTLENGQAVPWKQLNIGEYLEYSGLLEMGKYARATIEDEIFQKCVVDEYTLSNLPELKAGTVSTVVQDIILNSGPNTFSELNGSLQVFRVVASQAVHQTVALIAQAFPAYKLEDIYDMNYSDFMLRLAQAEGKLLQLGILEEPLNFQDPAESASPSGSSGPQQEKIGAMDMYLEYMKQQDPNSSKKESPQSNQTIISETDIRASQSNMISHEKTDNDIQSKQMLDDASVIYKEYIDALGAGEELKIKTPEERMVAASKRATENMQDLHKETLARDKKQKILDAKYAEIHKRFAAKKPR